MEKKDTLKEGKLNELQSEVNKNRMELEKLRIKTKNLVGTCDITIDPNNEITAKVTTATAFNILKDGAVIAMVIILFVAVLAYMVVHLYDDNHRKVF